MRKKVLWVFGTRPEAIKMAPLVHALKAEPDCFEVLVCVTGQHREMLDQVLEVFQIKPDIDLNLMRGEQDLFDVTSSVLLAMREVLAKHAPDLVLIHGDTTTALGTALAAFYSDIAIGHVEAGLRTHNLRAPFPEELNRRVASLVARWHFTPTWLSRENLIAEGVLGSAIAVTGNTVIDALFWVLDRIDSEAPRRRALRRSLQELLPFSWERERFVLITGHRRENFGDGFVQICAALRELSARFSNVQFVYPVHLNPNVQKPVHRYLADMSNVHLVPPLEYEAFVYLLKHAYLVLTDSGGIQEEAPSLGKPVLVMRNSTERPEGLRAGTVQLVGADKERIFSGVKRLLEDQKCYEKMSTAYNPYGDGKACQRILDVLRSA